MRQQGSPQGGTIVEESSGGTWGDSAPLGAVADFMNASGAPVAAANGAAATGTPKKGGAPGDGTANFHSTTAATNPVTASPTALHFGTLARGFSYQMMLTLTNHTSNPVTFTAKRVASRLPPGVAKHAVEVQAGRGVIPARGTTKIGVVVSASFVDPEAVVCNVCIESNASRQSLLVKVTATLADQGPVDVYTDPKAIVDRLPTTVKLLGVAQ